jgi:hypothetical protein
MEAGGRAAVDLLLSRVGATEDGHTVASRELSTNLIVRATTAPAANRSPATNTTPSGPGKGTDNDD